MQLCVTVPKDFGSVLLWWSDSIDIVGPTQVNHAFEIKRHKYNQHWCLTGVPACCVFVHSLLAVLETDDFFLPIPDFVVPQVSFLCLCPNNKMAVILWPTDCEVRLQTFIKDLAELLYDLSQSWNKRDKRYSPLIQIWLTYLIRLDELVGKNDCKTWQNNCVFSCIHFSNTITAHVSIISFQALG